MKNIFLLFVLIPFFSISQSTYESDFDKFLNDYEQYFGYLKDRDIDIKKIRAHYIEDVRSVSTRNEFISLMENVINEFYNGHISLNTSISTSNNIIPTGADIYAVKKGEKYFISDLRKGFPAENSGLIKGMEIIKYNDQNISEAIKTFLPKTVDSYNELMYEYALNMLLAGQRNASKKITVLKEKTEIDFIIDYSNFKLYNTILESKQIDAKTGYIKINNSLGNSDLIPAFDKALDSLFNLETIILDLTETPSGGNTMIGRAIMGRFISKELPYQIHLFKEKPYNTIRKWVELATPREEIYKGQLIVMVGHWTGSMGEGIAIGFDAMKRADIVGTKMAGLIGAIHILNMPNTGIGYSIPAEKMYHVNGTPREDFIPKFNTNNGDQTFKEAFKISKQ